MFSMKLTIDNLAIMVSIMYKRRNHEKQWRGDHREQKEA